MLHISNLIPEAWRPSATISREIVPCLPEHFPEPAGNSCQSIAKTSRKPSGHGALVLALMAAGRPVNITELARLMGCSVSQSSKRVKAAGKRVRCRRVGRCKLVELRG